MTDLSEKTAEELWHEYDVAAQNVNNTAVRLAKQTERDDIAEMRADEAVSRLDEVVGELRRRAELYEALREACQWLDDSGYLTAAGAMIVLVAGGQIDRNGEPLADFLVRAHRESKSLVPSETP